MALFLQESQRNIERDIVLLVGVKLAARVFDEDGRAASDPVDASAMTLAVNLEANVVTDMNVKGGAGLFPGGDQVVKCPFVGEDAPRQRVEVVGPTIGTAPTQELGQVQQLVLEDPLQRLEPVAADPAADCDCPLDIVKRVEQQRRRDRDLVVDASRPACRCAAPDEPGGRSGRPH